MPTTCLFAFEIATKPGSHLGGGRLSHGESEGIGSNSGVITRFFTIPDYIFSSFKRSIIKL